MRNILFGCAIWLATTLGALTCTAQATNSAPEARQPQMAKQLNIKKIQHLQLNYLLFLPKDYSVQKSKRWPLILFLHGAGERGTNIWKVATHGPPKIVNERPDFPFIVVSPQCPDGEVWSREVLLAFLEEVLATYSVDAARVYLTGLSMGGYGTWNLGLAYPEKFAAIVPICGGGELISVLVANGRKQQALRTLGIWAFHGAKDPTVPVAESERMVELVRHSGLQDVKLTVYPDAGHDSWTETYNNPKLYDWLLQHERKPSPRQSGSESKNAESLN